MRFSLPTALIAQLQPMNRRYNVWADSFGIIEREQACMLSPGMGDAYYLTKDGRVLVDGRDWDGEPVREATDDEAVSAIVIGAENSGISDLLKLLPEQPDSACVCQQCHGSRWWTFGNDTSGRAVNLVCPICSGRGWTQPTAYGTSIGA
jgi:hypothetical protein